MGLPHFVVDERNIRFSTVVKPFSNSIFNPASKNHREHRTAADVHFSAWFSEEKLKSQLRHFSTRIARWISDFLSLSSMLQIQNYPKIENSWHQFQVNEMFGIRKKFRSECLSGVDGAVLIFLCPVLVVHTESKVCSVACVWAELTEQFWFPFALS